MEFFKRNKIKIIGVLVVIIVLAVAFCCSKDAPVQEIVPEQVQTVSEIENTQEIEKSEFEKEIDDSKEEKKEITVPKAEKEPAPQVIENEKEETGPEAVKKTEETVDDKKLYCNFAIKCDELLENIDKLKAEKVGIVPEDGIILREEKIEFSEGESVFDVLLRVTREKKIHLEYVITPIYNSSYVEGIANLYEFDCGENSGWRYRLNGKMASIGCSEYKLKNGDSVVWEYSCDYTF